MCTLEAAKILLLGLVVLEEGGEAQSVSMSIEGDELVVEEHRRQQRVRGASAGRRTRGEHEREQGRDAGRRHGRALFTRRIVDRPCLRRA